MSKKTQSVKETKADELLEVYSFPEFGIAVKAETLEEATAIAIKKVKENE